MGKENIRIPYDVTANSYDELYRMEQYSKYAVILKNNLQPKSDDRVLDAGCGTCLLYEYLLKHNVSLKHYVGVDLSDGMLSICTAKELVVSPRVDLIQADIAYLPFREKCFEKIYTITVLDLVDNMRNIVEELLKLLTVNGLLVYTLLKHKGCKPGIEDTDVKDCIYVIGKV